MKVEYAEETSVRKALSFELEAELVDEELEKRAKEYAGKARLPGFRQGKVPVKVIKQRFRGQILEEAAEALVNRVVFPELDGRGLKPLATPNIEDLKIDEGQPMTFRAVFETLPLIEVPEYKGLPLEAREAEIPEDAVDKEVDRLREEAARFDPVEGRPARPGDFAVMDISWSSKDAEPGRDENAMLEVGSKDNHEDLNATIEGMEPDETRELTIKYAEDFPKKGLAGRTLEHTLTLKEIKQKILPEVDDEFAKDVGDFESLAALRDEIRSKLVAAEDRKIDREQRSALVDALVERSDFEVPQALVERHMDARTEGAARSLAYQGMDPSQVGIDWKEYRESQRDNSVKAAKADILLDEIAKREKIQVHPAELDSEIARFAERMKKSKEATRAQMEKEGELSSLEARMREEKTLDLLKANATVEPK